MDLNLDNYSIDEVKKIFNINDKNINISNGQKALVEKIDSIKKIASEALPESKETLIEFYTKAMFKLLNIPVNNNVVIDSSIFNGFEKQDSYVHNIEQPQNKSFISAKDKLINPLDNTPVVQENNHFISRHIDDRPINVYKNPLKSGQINPLTRNVITKIVNINTKFRDNYTITPSTDFIIQLPSTVKKVVSMKLIDTQFPKMAYTVSNKLGSNFFRIGFNDISAVNLDISNGSYTADSIENEINNRLLNLGYPWNQINLEFNPINGRMTFKNMGIAPPPHPVQQGLYIDFSYKTVVEFYEFKKNLQFFEDASANWRGTTLFCPQVPSNIYKDQLTLGWILGFRGLYIDKLDTQFEKHSNLLEEINLNKDPESFLYYIPNGTPQITGESLFDGHGSKYFLISVNDYQNNHDSCFISPFQIQTVSDNNIIAKIPTSCCDNCCDINTERIYFGPTDIRRLQIKIYDDFGRIVDFNNADYSFTLKLELLYDL